MFCGVLQNSGCAQSQLPTETQGEGKDEPRQGVNSEVGQDWGFISPSFVKHTGAEAECLSQVTH